MDFNLEALRSFFKEYHDLEKSLFHKYIYPFRLRLDEEILNRPMVIDDDTGYAKYYGALTKIENMDDFSQVYTSQLFMSQGKQTERSTQLTLFRPKYGPFEIHFSGVHAESTFVLDHFILGIRFGLAIRHDPGYGYQAYLKWNGVSSLRIEDIRESHLIFNTVRISEGKIHPKKLYDALRTPQIRSLPIQLRDLLDSLTEVSLTSGAQIYLLDLGAPGASEILHLAFSFPQEGIVFHPWVYLSLFNPVPGVYVMYR
ncbi:MAG: hypothetical protein QXM12_04160 [Nitrososphaerota archaeon]